MVPQTRFSSQLSTIRQSKVSDLAVGNDGIGADIESVRARSTHSNGLALLQLQIVYDLISSSCNLKYIAQP